MKRFWLLASLLFFITPARAADEIPFPDISCETTATTGTGTISLAGALTGGYLPFATQVVSGNSVYYNIVTGTGASRKVEVGKGVFTDATPDTLTRVADWSTDGTGAELTLAGTSRVCIDVSGGFFNQGAGSGLNADLLDSTSSTSFGLTGRKSLWVPAGAMFGTATLPADCNTLYDSGANDITARVCAYDQTNSERAEFNRAMPNNWDEGTVTFQVYWTAGAGSAAQTTNMDLACVAVSDDDSLNATFGTVQGSDDALIAANDLHVAAESAAITCGGSPAAGDLLLFRLTRDIADTLAADVLVLGIRIFYTEVSAVE